MDKKEAKELTLEVWRYLRDHPEITYKCDLPVDLFYKIKDMKYRCPLCELFSNGHGHLCLNCPLKTCMDHSGSPYDLWNSTKRSEKQIRQQAAAEIVKLVEAWEV